MSRQRNNKVVGNSKQEPREVVRDVIFRMAARCNDVDRMSLVV